MKTVEEIKLEAYDSSESLHRTLMTYDLTLDEVGVFYLDNTTNLEQVDTRKYPVSIFYSIIKDEIKQLKVDFTNEKIKEAVKHQKTKYGSIAS